MKSIVLTTAIILGAAAPSFAGNIPFTQEQITSDDGLARFAAKQVEKGAVSVNTGVVSSKSGPIATIATEELARSDEGEDRFLAEQIAQNEVSANAFGDAVYTQYDVQELLDSDDGADRLLARHLIKTGAVVN